jgi:hypothetical protein
MYARSGATAGDGRHPSVIGEDHMADTWDDVRVQRWLDQAEGLDRQLAPVTAALFDAARPWLRSRSAWARPDGGPTGSTTSPSSRRRTRDPEDVDLSWEIDAFRFELPIMAAAMDSVVSPASAVAIGELGGVGVLALEGLWTRYDDPEPLLAEIAGLG